VPRGKDGSPALPKEPDIGESLPVPTTP